MRVVWLTCCFLAASMDSKELGDILNLWPAKLNNLFSIRPSAQLPEPKPVEQLPESIAAYYYDDTSFSRSARMNAPNYYMDQVDLEDIAIDWPEKERDKTWVINVKVNQPNAINHSHARKSYIKEEWNERQNT